MKKKLSLIVILVFTLSIILTACGGGGDSGSDDTAAAGQELFSQTVIGAQPGCITCHSLDEGVVIVGPSMAGIATRAGSTVPGQSADEYLRDSILHPDAHLVEGFPAGTMPQVWGDELTDDQINQLVAYLLTLK
jgi:nitric oxide reductase subunit C